MEFMRISDNVETWCGINREDSSKKRPTHTVEYIPAGERMSAPQNDGFYHKEADEPHFVIRNANSATSGITISLSQINTAMSYSGMVMKVEDCPTVPRLTKEEMYKKSEKTGLNQFPPTKGSGRICFGCPHQFKRHSCVWEERVTIKRFNDGVEYCFITSKE